MLRLLIDEDVNHRILRGLKTRVPELDLVTVRQIGLAGSDDLSLLRWPLKRIGPFSRMTSVPCLITQVNYCAPESQSQE